MTRRRRETLLFGQFPVRSRRKAHDWPCGSGMYVSGVCAAAAGDHGTAPSVRGPNNRPVGAAWGFEIRVGDLENTTQEFLGVGAYGWCLMPLGLGGHIASGLGRSVRYRRFAHGHEGSTPGNRESSQENRPAACIKKEARMRALLSPWPGGLAPGSAFQRWCGGRSSSSESGDESSMRSLKPLSTPWSTSSPKLLLCSAQGAPCGRGAAGRRGITLGVQGLP